MKSGENDEQLILLFIDTRIGLTGIFLLVAGFNQRKYKQTKYTCY